MRGCGARRDDNKSVARLERRSFAGQRDRRIAKRAKVYDSDQARVARSGSLYQCSRLNAE
jgi:hypothetical protein